MSKIISEPNDNAMVGGDTRYDGENLQATLETDSHGSTIFVLGRSGNTLSFSGREARTLLRVLASHYENVVTS